MYYKTQTNALYWYDTGTPLTGLPDGSIPISIDEAKQINGDELHGPSPHPSWVLHESESYWVAPTPMLTDGLVYGWDEATLSWTLIE
jgi:hypothetical protein